MKVAKPPYFDGDGNLIIKPYHMKQLAEIYQVHPRTIGRWINEVVPHIDKKKRRYFMVEEVITIINAIGLPHTIQGKNTA